MPEIIDFGSLTLRFLRDKRETGGNLDMFETTLLSWERMPVPHYHETWDETVFGIFGTTTFTVDGTAHGGGPGAVLALPRGEVHGFDDRSGAPATNLYVLTPGALGPEYFGEFAALVATGAPDSARVRAIMLRHGPVPA